LRKNISEKRIQYDKAFERANESKMNRIENDTMEAQIRGEKKLFSGLAFMLNTEHQEHELMKKDIARLPPGSPGIIERELEKVTKAEEPLVERLGLLLGFRSREFSMEDFNLQSKALDKLKSIADMLPTKPRDVKERAVSSVKRQKELLEVRCQTLKASKQSLLDIIPTYSELYMELKKLGILMKELSRSPNPNPNPNSNPRYIKEGALKVSCEPFFM